MRCQGLSDAEDTRFGIKTTKSNPYEASIPASLLQGAVDERHIKRKIEQDMGVQCGREVNL